MFWLVMRYVILSLCCCRAFSITDSTLPYGLFYPFGEDEGDSVVPIVRKKFSEVQLSKAVAFDNEYFGKVNVESHGVLAFGHRVDSDDPEPFPYPGKTLCATYWAGTDTSFNDGRVYYRETDDSQLLEQATQEFRADLGSTHQMYSFSPQKLFITTWHNVTFNRYGSHSTPVNSFQAILAWSRKQTAVSYRYGKLTWTTRGYSAGNTDGTGVKGATMGYSGNAEFYYSHEWSGTSQILHLVNNSNVGVVGRYSYRLDRLSNSTDCFENDADAEDICPLPYQRYDETLGQCYDFAPSFGCPVLTGPLEKPSGIFNQKKFEFNCAIANTSGSPGALFDVAFYFNGEVDCSVPSGCQERVSVTAGATLSSDSLRGKNKMGKWIGCKVRSCWEGFEDRKSNNLTSNEYYMGLEFSTRSIQVREDELLPKTILVKSTVPITCVENFTSSTCTLKLKYHVINEKAGESTVAFRQRYPTEKPFGNGCEFIIKQADWKQQEHRAYNVEGSLEVLAKLDPFVTGPRTAWVTFVSDSAGSEQSIWYGYESPIIEVHHLDVAEPLVGCHVNADPHLLTYDKVAYSTHCHGKFHYARNSPGGVGFEVQVRHCPCWGSSGDLKISCICGIAIREDRAIIVADTCYERRVIQYTSKEDHRYQCSSDNGCGMFVDGTSFKLVTPSGSRIYGTLIDKSPSYAHINVQVMVSARFRNVTGLCGSPDGVPENDWMFANDGRIEQIPPGKDPWPPKSLVDSWGSPGPQESLFEYKVHPDLPDIQSDWDRRLLINYCQCTRDRETGITNRTCGGSAIAQQQWPGDPKNSLPAPDPEGIPSDSYCDNFLENPQYCGTSMLQRSTSWPTPRGMTEAEANNTCWSRIMNSGVIGRTCYEIMMNDTETAQKYVNQCVADIQETDDPTWAYDKINGVQRICYFDLITRNNSEMENTDVAKDQVLITIQEVTHFMCVPVDCNGHGDCINGTCLCERDYVGSDCGVLRSARPVIRALLSKGSLDVRTNNIDGVSLYALDVANTPEMACKFEASLLNGLSKTFTNHGIVTSPSTVVCKIPNEPMNYNSKGLDFTKLHSPGFNFSCLSAGSAVVHYALSISNDGQTFSNTVEIKLFDSLCVDCNNVTCTRVPKTCAINGYCFADQDVNPFNGCEVCDTTISDNSWTLSTADGSCTEPSIHQPTGTNSAAVVLAVSDDSFDTTSATITDTGTSRSTYVPNSPEISSVVIGFIVGLAMSLGVPVCVYAMFIFYCLRDSIRESSCYPQNEALSKDNEEGVACSGEFGIQRHDEFKKETDKPSPSTCTGAAVELTESTRIEIFTRIEDFNHRVRNSGVEITNCMFDLRDADVAVEIWYVINGSTECSEPEWSERNIWRELKLPVQSCHVRLVHLKKKPEVKMTAAPGNGLMSENGIKRSIGAIVGVEGQGKHVLTAGHGLSIGDRLHLSGRNELVGSVRAVCYEGGNMLTGSHDSALCSCDTESDHFVYTSCNTKRQLITYVRAPTLLSSGGTTVQKFINAADNYIGNIHSRDFSDTAPDGTCKRCITIESPVPSQAFHGLGESGVLVTTPPDVVINHPAGIEHVQPICLLTSILTVSPKEGDRRLSIAVPLERELRALAIHLNVSKITVCGTDVGQLPIQVSN